MFVRLASPLVLVALATGCPSPTTGPVFTDCDTRAELTNDMFVGGAVLESGSCWFADSALSLSDGTVTIEDGVSIHFATGTAVRIGSGGTLRMAGTADAPIELGTSDPLVTWMGVQLSDSQGSANVWEHVFVDNAGGDNWNGADYSAAAVYVDGSSTLQMDNVNVRFSAGHGLLLRTADVDVSFANGSFEGNDVPAYVHPQVADAIGGETSFVDNTNAYVRVVYSNTDSIDDDRTWAALDVPYRVEDRFYVEGGLTVVPGTVIEMAQGASMNVRPNAELDMSGNEAEPITVQGADSLAGFWMGIANQGQLTMDFVDVSGTGSDRWSGAADSTAGIYLNVESSSDITNSTISNHEGFALWAAEDARLETFDGNAIMDGELTMKLHPDRVGELAGTSVITGNDDDRVHIVFSNTNRVSTDATWKDLEVPYYVSDRFYVAAGLTIDPAVEIEVAQDVGIIVEPEGSLTVNGTEDDRVEFRGASTSTNGFWMGIRFDSDEPGNDLEHVLLRDTGSSTWTGDGESDAALYLADNSALTLNNVEIGPGGGYGMYLRDDVALSCTSVVWSSLQDGAVWDDVAGAVLPGC